MNHIFNKLIILYTFVFFVFQQVFASESKSCESWIIDDEKMPLYFEGTTDVNRVNVVRYKYSIEDPDRFNKFNFWKNAYSRYKYYEEYGRAFNLPKLTPVEFCNKIGGKYAISSELIEHDTLFPCHVWILICGYKEFDLDTNIQKASERVNENFDIYLSEFANDYAKYLLEKNTDDDDQSSSLSSISKKLNPLSFCEQILHHPDNKFLRNIVIEPILEE